MQTLTNQDTESLWAITCYFNPVGYKRRLSNYRTFKQLLKIPLIAVELSYDGNFHLQTSDADILVQLCGQGQHVLWQKERLLNLALQALPDNCDKVAWLDCDVVFESNDWAHCASQLLDEFATVQLFKTLHHLPRDVMPEHVTPEHMRAFGAIITEPSSIFNVVAGKLTDNTFRGAGGASCSPGVAWASRREVITKHGFYDACIIGGGDGAMTHAAFGKFDQNMQCQRMNQDQTRYYLAWAEPYFETVRNSVAFVDCDLFHLWHGDFGDRKYQQRHDDLGQFNFDPFIDIAVDDNGCWRWNTHKPDMHQYVKAYFAFRNEDGSS